jgi:hypothetical protein
MSAKSIFSEYLALPKDSPQHKQFRKELWLGGTGPACRYYLSILLGRDFFAVSSDEFLKAIREYVSAKTCPEAMQFCCLRSDFAFVLPFLRREWEIAEGIADQRRLGKEEQGMILLIQHPDSSDEQIRQAVRTTAKQMKRWGNFNYARIAQQITSTELRAGASSDDIDH